MGRFPAYGETRLAGLPSILLHYPVGAFNVEGIDRAWSPILERAETVYAASPWVLVEVLEPSGAVTPQAMAKLGCNYRRIAKLGCISILMVAVESPIQRFYMSESARNAFIPFEFCESEAAALQRGRALLAELSDSTKPRSTDSE